MTHQTLIAVDPDALAALTAEVRALRQRLDQVQVQPQREWITLREAAHLHDVSESTVRRWVRDGKIEAKGEGRAKMVRL